MNKVYEDLDDAKTEIEKLEAELRGETNSLPNLKKSHDTHVNQIQEAKFKVEKLDQELLQNEDEINDADQMNEDLKGNLNDQEYIIKHISAANDKLRADCDEKFKKWDDEKRGLALALEEANEKVGNQEQQINVYRQEIESMKGCLSVSNKKCLEMEECLKACKELRERDYVFQKLEDENIKVGEQLKWKEEHFHLEEAHEKLSDQFKSSKNEWELEISTLLDEISSLQIKLDSQIRISEDLQHQLQMCNQAHADEESKRKHQADDVSDFKVRFDDVSCEYQDVGLQLDCLSSQRDKDIGDLRDSLKAKEPYDEESLQNELGMHKEMPEEHSLQNELDRHNEMLEESTECQLVNEKVLHMESDLKEQLKEVCDALDMANIELDERICERSEMECELLMWKSFVERLKNDLEENLLMRKELENSLLAQVDFSEILKKEKDNLFQKLEEKERSIDYLKQNVFLLEQGLKVRETEASVPARGEETAVSCETDEVRHLQIIEEKDKNLEKLVKEVVCLEEESLRREFESGVIAKCSMERTNELEKENSIQFIEGNNTKIDELMQQVTSLEQKFTTSMTSFSSQLAEKQAEINQVQEACDQITAAEILAALEIEEKKLMIVELEDDIHDMEQKLKLQEENGSQSKQLALDIDAEMDAKQLKIKDLTDQMDYKFRGSDVLLQKLKMENINLLENATRLSSEREKLVDFVQGLGDTMCECNTADTQLMDMLRSVVQSFENDSPGMNLKKYDEFLVKENTMVHSPTGMKKPEIVSDIRSPFKELNS